MMQLEFRPYCRPFQLPLQTAHGLWPQRAGLILRLAAESGRVTFGEIAPIPWFGTETLAQASEFCRQWPARFKAEQILTIPNTLPACQFGFAAGLRVTSHEPVSSPRGNASVEALESGLKIASRSPGIGNVYPLPPALPYQRQVLSAEPLAPVDICGLLPAGQAALDAWSTLWERGHRTFKWKIGVAAVAAELALFRQLVTALPEQARLRLDANGGLTREAAAAWLTACDSTTGKVEFLEQPLPPDHSLDWLSTAVHSFKTAIALDESVATVHQLEQVYQRLGNAVVYVVKPAIAGFPHRLLDFCQQHPLDVVISSALETPIGRHAALQLAQQLWALGRPKRALGFGVGQWFADDWDALDEAALWESL
ncbi:MAG: o-succinylbenzoate synthase [Cyanobacteria bacterium P01_H01_bin.162]